MTLDLFIYSDNNTKHENWSNWRSSTSTQAIGETRLLLNGFRDFVEQHSRTYTWLGNYKPEELEMKNPENPIFKVNRVDYLIRETGPSKGKPIFRDKRLRQIVGRAMSKRNVRRKRKVILIWKVIKRSQYFFLSRQVMRSRKCYVSIT